MTTLLDQGAAFLAEARAFNLRMDKVLARMEAQSTAWYVDQIRGDDEAAGTASAPLKTIDEAVDRSAGGYIQIWLLADYHLDHHVPAHVDHIAIDGILVNGVKPKLTSEWFSYVDNFGSDQQLAVGGLFNCRSISARNLRVELPADPAGGTPIAAHLSGVLNSAGQHGNTSLLGVKCAECDFTFAIGSATARIFAIARGWSVLQFTNCTFQAGFNGKVLYGVSTSDPTSLAVTRQVITNLTWL